MQTIPNRGPDAAQFNSPTNFLKDAAEDGPLPWADDQAEPLTAEQIARAADAINFVLAAAAVPFEHRALIDALIGASEGAMDWFECADIVIAQRARNAKKLEVKEKSTEKWTQREREELTKWQTARGITLIESMPGGWKEGVKYKTRYRLGNLFRLAIATDRRARAKPGFDRNPKRELRKAAEAVYSEFRAQPQEPAKTNRFRRGRRTCDTYLKIINTALEQLSGRAYIENRNLVELLDGISLKIQEKRELLIPSTAPLSNSTQTQQTQTVSTGGMVDISVHWENRANGPVHTTQKEEYGQGGCDSPLGGEAPREESQQRDEARALEAFRSVGCESFEWFYLTDETKKQGEYHRTSGAELAEEISGIVQDAETYGDSCIVRVRGAVLQLDDCEGLTASLLHPFALATFETSRENYQVWLAFNDPEDKAFVAERIFQGVKAVIPSKINPGAGGAIRWPGSINQKPERNGFRVRVHSINPGRFVTPSELEDAGLLKEPKKVEWDFDADGPVGEWPDYDRCLKDKDGDRSRADAQFTYFALKRRIKPEDIAAKLAQISDKAKQGGASYINRTIASEMKYLGLEVSQ